MSNAKTIVADDMHASSRYLACSLETCPETVVPILREGRVLGEIETDSDAPAAVTEDERKLLEAVAEILAERL